MPRSSRPLVQPLITMLGALLVASSALAAEGAPAQADQQRSAAAVHSQVRHPYSLSNPYRLHTKRHKHRQSKDNPAQARAAAGPGRWAAGEL